MVDVDYLTSVNTLYGRQQHLARVVRQAMREALNEIDPDGEIVAYDWSGDENGVGRPPTARESGEDQSIRVEALLNRLRNVVSARLVPAPGRWRT